MGWADPAGGEQIVVFGPERVHGRHDLLVHVGHHPHLGEPDPLHVEPGRDRRDVAVLDAAGQDLVADDQQGRRPDTFFGHCPALDQEAQLVELAQMAICRR
jgi:hypothetical protein